MLIALYKHTEGSNPPSVFSFGSFYNENRGAVAGRNAKVRFGRPWLSHAIHGGILNRGVFGAPSRAHLYMMITGPVAPTHSAAL